MYKYSSLPTFLLMKFAMLFADDNHPLKNSKITLAMWNKDETQTTVVLDIFFWFVLVLIGIFLIRN